MASPEWERIDPGRAPGGLVFRLTAGGRVWREYGITAEDHEAEVEREAEADGLYAVELAERFGESRLFVYDGDTGECVTTAVTQPGESDG
jgi:hypothetical protein